MPRVLINFEKMRQLECGLGQFSLELARAMLTEREPADDLCFFLPKQHVHRFCHEPVEIQLVQRWQKDSYLAPVRGLLNRFFPGPWYDVWHASNQCSRYEPWNSNVPVVLTIHDLNFLREKTPEVIDSKLRLMQRRADRAICVTTISKFVANEVRTHLDLQGKPLRVIYNGAARETDEITECPSFAPKGPFLFSIGDFMAKKNFHVLVEMIAYLPDYALVLAGNNSSDYGRLVRERAKACDVIDRVILPGRISNAQRQWLYTHCAAFAFPSITEGFGLPVIEAMNAGKPVFLSTATSLPEIGGRCGFYWESFDPRAMADRFRLGMAQVASTPNHGQIVRQHASQFSWQRAAQEYLALYREIAVGQTTPGAENLGSKLPRAA